ncbi:50S ribosomal protein L19 [Candidatus Saccharibacteria bacterium]|nr:50S ribosomal protein L19 [Candidatus Saccharibacteria bacterium]MBR0372862.1 50S ribosomal protein L19 [Candidatus Saccharibacteria bacterium]
MSFSILKQIGDAQKKKAVVDVRSGDTVRVTQKIKEGNKFRLQVFEGVVIRVDRKESHTARIVVRKVTSGVGVEKSYLIHSPLVEKIEITKRSKVRRNNLSYLRQRSGKSARLRGKDFDRVAVNDVTVPEEEATEVKEEAEVEVVETPAEEVKEETEKVEETKEEKEEAKEEKEEAKEETEAEAKDEAEKEAEA